MLNNENIEDIILSTLKKGPHKTTDLIGHIKKIRPLTTKQAVYLIFKKLKKQGAVTVSKKMVALNIMWLKKLEEFYEQAHQNYMVAGENKEYFLNLKEGEKVKYYFNNIRQLDYFWNHALMTLIESSSNIDLVYAPHYWWSILEADTEKDFYDLFPKLNKKAYILIGGNTSLDKNFRPYNKNMQVHYLGELLNMKTNYHYNVIGDFVIEVLMDKKICQKIDKFYQDHTVLDAENKKELGKIIAGLKKSKFIIRHNKRKANKLRAKFKKYFFIDSIN